VERNVLQRQHVPGAERSITPTSACSWYNTIVLLDDRMSNVEGEAMAARQRHWLGWLTVRLSPPATGFGPASAGEPTVFGARRPGFPFSSVPPEAVDRWIAFMRLHNIRRVVCLLPPRQLAGYDRLLECYRDTFGAECVCWAPIDDFRLADTDLLIGRILPFLAEADRLSERVVVHCSGGIGRTGHVLAAWLVSARNMANEEAIQVVRRGGRNPREAGDPRLDQLLDACRCLDES
jgi:protein-tyrosine phosphatase